MKVLVFKPNINQNGYPIESATIKNDHVPVWINFDKSVPPIGNATLSYGDNGEIWADFTIDDSLQTKGLYPAIGGDLDGVKITIREIGVCSNENTDPRIKPFDI